MEKMRSSTGPILWVLVVAFGVLFMLQDTQVFDAVMAGPRTMGEVEGRPITSEEYNRRVSAYADQFRQQTGSAPNIEQNAYYRELVWEQMIIDLALKSEMDRLGIQVTDREIIDAVFGDEPDPVIRQLFGREDGSIDYATLRAVAEADEAQAEWIILENQIRERRAQEKINKYMESAIKVSQREIEQDFIRANTSLSLSYVRFPFSDISDDEISVSDSDIRSYYRNNRERFKQDKNWRFRFVTFSKEPTADDTTRSLQRIADLRQSFADAQDDSLFLVMNYSNTNYDASYRSPSEVRQPFYQVFELETGEVSDAVLDDSNVAIFKKVGSRSAGNTYIRSNKIQLNFDSENRSEKQALANEIVSGLRDGDSFSDHVHHSNDSSTRNRGGDTGYRVSADYPSAVRSAISRASAGSVVGPTEVDGAFHIYRVEHSTDREVAFVVMSQPIEADASATINAQERLADDFRAYAELDGFEQEAERNDFSIQQGSATKDTPFITGLGESRVVLRWLERSTRGQISDVVELDDKFLVIKVDEVRESGVRPLDEVRDQVENAVRQQKRKDLMAERVRSQFSSPESLESLAEQADRSVQNASNVRMNSTNVSGAGREPGLVGAAFAAETGAVKGPFIGENAVFYFKVNERREADLANLSDSERNRIRTRLQQNKQRVFTEKLVERLKEQANIRDHRELLGMN